MALAGARWHKAAPQFKDSSIPCAKTGDVNAAPPRRRPALPAGKRKGGERKSVRTIRPHSRSIQDDCAQPAEPRARHAAEPMRIAKALARAGLCSRREAERWIADGRVSVNGKVLASPARDVAPATASWSTARHCPRRAAAAVALPQAAGPRHHPQATRKGRPTVFDALPPMPRVISVGRLDFNTEGLLLLTNDGALARHLELPATGWLRRYRVRAHGAVTQDALDKLKDGIEIDGVRYGPIEATLDKPQGSNVWLTIGLREGKNREVRRSWRPWG